MKIVEIGMKSGNKFRCQVETLNFSTQDMKVIKFETENVKNPGRVMKKAGVLNYIDLKQIEYILVVEEIGKK